MFCFITSMYWRKQTLFFLKKKKLCEQILECVFCMRLHSYTQTHTALSIQTLVWCFNEQDKEFIYCPFVANELIYFESLILCLSSLSEVETEAQYRQPSLIQPSNNHLVTKARRKILPLPNTPLLLTSCHDSKCGGMATKCAFKSIKRFNYRATGNGD